MLATLKQIVRKTQRILAPLPIVNVRWDSESSAWVSVHSNNAERIIETLRTPCYLVGVKFQTAQVSKSLGCGAYSTLIVGLATGGLSYRIPGEVKDSVPCNFGFKDGKFRANNSVINAARVLRLSADRFATIYP
jgi:hypothetical protein